MSVQRTGADRPESQTGENGFVPLGTFGIGKRQLPGHSFHRRRVHPFDKASFMTVNRGLDGMKFRPPGIGEVAVMVAVDVVKNAGGFQNTLDFQKGRFRVRQIPNDVAGNNGGDGVIRERQVFGVRREKRN